MIRETDGRVKSFPTAGLLWVRRSTSGNEFPVDKGGGGEAASEGATRDCRRLKELLREPGGDRTESRGRLLFEEEIETDF